jgi:hypothetical protein
MINSVVELDTLVQRFASRRINVLQTRNGGRSANESAERASLAISKGIEWYEANSCAVLCGSIHDVRSCFAAVCSRLYSHSRHDFFLHFFAYIDREPFVDLVSFCI